MREIKIFPELVWIYHFPSIEINPIVKQHDQFISPYLKIKFCNLFESSQFRVTKGSSRSRKVLNEVRVKDL